MVVMSSSNTGKNNIKTEIHDKCGTDDCCQMCDTAIGDTPPTDVQKQLEKTYEQVHKAMDETSQSRSTE